MVIEEITEEMNKKEIYDLMSNLNFGFLLSFTFVVAVLVSFLIVGLLKSATDLIKQNDLVKVPFKRFVFENLFPSQWNERVAFTAVSVFLLFFNLYIWFVCLTVQNYMKTNKVQSIRLL